MVIVLYVRKSLFSKIYIQYIIYSEMGWADHTKRYRDKTLGILRFVATSRIIVAVEYELYSAQ